MAGTEVDPPIPTEAIAALERRLDRSLAGWADCPPLHRSPMPLVEGVWFDVDAVVHVVERLRELPHTKGEWGGTPFDPAAWQVVWIIAPVFGWKRPDGRRLIRKVWDEIPRKNGKSSLAARLALVLLAADGEYGAEVYAAATSTDQARQVFDQARQVVLGAPKLRSRLQPLSSVIRSKTNGGFFRVLSRVAQTAHGLNVHGVVIDEVHVHATRDLIEALETGRGARRQPLILYITTAGDEDETTIYAVRHKFAVQVAAGEIVAPTWWVVIWAAEQGDDPFDEATWRKANPNFGVTPTAELLAEEFETARVSPTDLAAAKRLYLNVRGSADEAWTGTHHWAKGSAELVVDAQIKGAKAWGGLVIASATDLCALAWIIRAPMGKGYWQRWRWFLPEGSLDDLDRRTNGAASIWADPEKRITITEGDQIELDPIIEQIRVDCRYFDVQKLAYDPNGSIGVISKLVESNVVDVVPVYPTSPASAMIDWERMLIAGEIAHGGDPIAAWQVPHVRVKPAATGVVKINRRDSTENVFGIAAAELALRMALMEVEQPSAVMHGASF